MASQEIQKEITNLVKQGDVRNAYAKFEELPLAEQITVSLSPVVGDALAGYEVFEFGKRAETKLKEGDILGGAGYAGLSALSGISLIPLFRILRGGRGAAKAVTSTGETASELPVVEQVKEVKPTPPTPPKKAPVPKLDKIPDTGENIRKLAYPGTEGLISNTRREIHFGNYPDQMKMQSFINKIKNKVPNGELRTLEVLDAQGNIHPNFIKRFGSIQDKISLKGFDDYLAQKQKDAFQFETFARSERSTANPFNTEGNYPLSPRVIDEASFVGDPTTLRDVAYRSKFTDAHKAGRVNEHYNQDFNDVFVFDASTDMNTGYLNDRFVLNSARLLAEKLNTINVYKNNLKSAEEVGEDVADYIDIPALKGAYKDYTKELENLGVPKNKQTEIMKYGVAKIKDEGIPPSREELFRYGTENLDLLQDIYRFERTGSGQILNINRIQSDYAEDVGNVRDTLKRTNPKASGYEMPEVTKKLQKEIDKINELTEKQNKKIAEGARNLDDDVYKLEEQINELLLEKPDGYKFNFIMPSVDKLTKNFKNSKLRKAFDKYRKDVRSLKFKGSFLKYVRSKDIFEKNSSILDTKIDGKKVRLNKPISGFESNLYKLDPFASKNRPVVSKIVIRKRLEEAVKGNYDGIYLDSGRKVTNREGGQGSKIIDVNYEEAGSELAKVIREMGFDPKEIKVIDTKKNPNLARAYDIADEGYYYPFSREFRKAVLEKGINAFKFGGEATSIQKLLDDINKDLGIDKVELDVGSIEPIKELEFPKPVGSEGFEKTLLSLGTRGISDVVGSDDNMQSIIFYMMARRLPSAERAKLFIDPLKKKIAKLEKDKKKYVETHQAKNVDKYKQKLNSFDQEIKKLEKNIKENKISYDLEDL